MQTTRRDTLLGLGAAGLLTACGGLRTQTTSFDAPELQAAVKGRVWTPGSPGYELARASVWQGNVPERYPACIVRAATTEDVVAAVRFAKENGLRVAVRGGGHNWSAGSLREGALMIDLGALADLHIDAEARRAIVQPGVSGGALVDAAMAVGLIFPIAHCPSVPMSGFLLNGGYGFNAGDWGPSALLIEEMEIVTAEGDLVRASETENSNLFWAARGAGPAFFGIVTRFHLRLLPPRRSIVATNYIFPLDATAEATEALQRVRNDCPSNVELTFLASAGAGPPQAPQIGIVSGIAFADDDQDARRSLDFLDSFSARGAAIMIEDRVSMNWADLFEAVAALFPSKMNYLGNTIWTDASVPELYAPYAAHLSNAPTPFAFSNCVLYPPGFAQKAKGYDAALSMQGDILSLQYAIWQDATETDQNEEWFRQSTALFQSHAQGHYIGETDLNLYPEFARNSFSPETWERLADLRARFDPDGLFFDFLGHEGGRT